MSVAFAMDELGGTRRPGKAWLPPPRWPRWTTLRAALVLLLVATSLTVALFELATAWLVQWAWKEPPHPDDRQTAAIILALGALPAVLATATVALLRQTRTWFWAAALGAAVVVAVSLTFLTGPTDPDAYRTAVPGIAHVSRLRAGSLGLQLSFWVFWTHIVVAVGVGLDVVLRSYSVRRLE